MSLPPSSLARGCVRALAHSAGCVGTPHLVIARPTRDRGVSSRTRGFARFHKIAAPQSGMHREPCLHKIPAGSGSRRDRGGASRASGVEWRSGVGAVGADEVPAALAQPGAAAARLDPAGLAGVDAILLVAAQPAPRAAHGHVVFHDHIERGRRDFFDGRRGLSSIAGRSPDSPVAPQLRPRSRH